MVEGITWIGCGGFLTLKQPVLSITYFSTVIIQKCVFQYSLGAAINVVNMLGNVNISHCNFTDNNHYTDHGSAITYKNTLSFFRSLQLNSKMNICNCNFGYNEAAKSIVYIIIYKLILYVNNSKFYNNKGVSMYISGNIILCIIEDIYLKIMRQKMVQEFIQRKKRLL